MIRYLFALTIFIHGLIHLLGFLKGFGVGQLNQITAQISQTAGVFWLTASILMMLSSVLFVLNNSNWVWTSIAATALSQVLIIMVWQDAKFGTIPNLIVVFALLVTIMTKEASVIFRD